MTRSDTVAIVFYQESTGVPPAVRAWQERNPAWRRSLDEVIICPVCGLPIRAIADMPAPPTPTRCTAPRVATAGTTAA